MASPPALPLPLLPPPPPPPPLPPPQPPPQPPSPWTHLQTAGPLQLVYLEYLDEAHQHVHPARCLSKRGGVGPPWKFPRGGTPRYTCTFRSQVLSVSGHRFGTSRKSGGMVAQGETDLRGNQYRPVGTKGRRYQGIREG
uniref:Uncharacterized protein n=1 Tax=Vespula pensylvanica TaxID=30213 RepID=A0A834P933_VESPE|nr:hypothetical protein H0235_005208 [Vespula pensylvanica]